MTTAHSELFLRVASYISLDKTERILQFEYVTKPTENAYIRAMKNTFWAYVANYASCPDLLGD